MSISKELLRDRWKVMDIKEFLEMQKRYLDEFGTSEHGHSHLGHDHSYIEWNEIFEEWVDTEKVGDLG